MGGWWRGREGACTWCASTDHTVVEEPNPDYVARRPKYHYEVRLRDLREGTPVPEDVLEPKDKRVRYAQCPAGSSLGLKRNLGVREALGAIQGRKSENPNFKGSYLGRFPLVSADFWTRDHLSERSRP